MYEGWMSLGGAEVANNERYAVYAGLLGLPVPRDEVRCLKLPAVLSDAGYAAGGLAAAPWADASTAEAAGFAGVFVTSVTGLDASAASRVVVDAAGDGGIPGPGRYGVRTVLVTAFLSATSEVSLGYGLSWLAAVLRDECADACAGAQLCMLAGCPDCPVPDGAAADACWEDLYRSLHDVTCVDGPRVTARHPLSSCGEGAVGATVEFTLVAAVPHIYRAPAEVAAGLAFTIPAPGVGCGIEWVETGAGRGTCAPVAVCAPVSSCLVDPHARPLPALPQAPPAPGACVDRLVSAHALANAAPGVVPRWLDSVPVITVTAGGGELRRLTLRFHPNPALIAVTDWAQLDPCTASAEINLSYLPRDTVLVIDGRSETAYAVCPGGVIEPAESLLYGPGGGPWDWPLLTCGGGFSVVALADAEFVSAGARVDVALAARQDVA